jgi:RHS repeat-associated protein
MKRALRSGNYYFYSFDGKLLRQYDISGVLLKDFIFMGNRLIAEYDRVGNRYLYYTQDQISSTRVVTDSSGTVVYSEAYNPYGGVQKTWVNSFDPLPKFSGKERDKESGLDYFGARYYDRAQYRFISADPLIILQGAQATPQRWNLYVYCVNNPAIITDPSGKYGVDVHFGWTLRIAEMAGLSSSFGNTIATACALVDFRLDTTSFSPEMPMVTLANYFSGAGKAWHFPSDDQLARAVDVALGTYDSTKLGEALHIIQDSFSHSGYERGHLLETIKSWIGLGKDPDDPKSNWDDAMDMAQLTLDILRAYNERMQAAISTMVVGVKAAMAGIGI